MAVLGFVGTGTIAEAMVCGLKSGPFADWPILLSPRGAAVAARLAGQFAGVEVMPGNQDVVDGAEIVVLSVRPQVAEEIVRGLRCHPGQKVLSLIAGVRHETLRDWIGQDLPIVRAIPLPFVAERSCVTPIFPADPEIAAIFNALGGVIEVDDLNGCDAYAAASAVMATYFGFVREIAVWLEGRDLPSAAADAYLRSLIGNLGDVMRREAGTSLAALREAYATKGGLNELVHERFLSEGGGQALQRALDAVWARLKRP